MTNLINGLSPTDFLTNMTDDLFRKPTKPAVQAISRYFAADYQQDTDGKSVTLAEQAGHFDYVQKHMTSLEFDLQQVVFDGEWLATRHLGRVVMDGGKPVESEVATFFRIVDGRIAESFEMTRPLSGIEADRDVHTAR